MLKIDPQNLPMWVKDGNCVPFFPHEFLRVNTLFEVVKMHGGHTAWSDKHPSYELLNGPSGKGLDELYALEQDSLIRHTKVKTTGSFKAEIDLDEMRVKAVLNMMAGKNGGDDKSAPIPNLFGLNFQAAGKVYRSRTARSRNSSPDDAQRNGRHEDSILQMAKARGAPGTVPTILLRELPLTGRVARGLLRGRRHIRIGPRLPPIGGDRLRLSQEITLDFLAFFRI
jgi:hypothetical protein